MFNLSRVEKAVKKIKKTPTSSKKRKLSADDDDFKSPPKKKATPNNKAVKQEVKGRKGKELDPALVEDKWEW